MQYQIKCIHEQGSITVASVFRQVPTPTLISIPTAQMLVSTTMIMVRLLHQYPRRIDAWRTIKWTPGFKKMLMPTAMY